MSVTHKPRPHGTVRVTVTITHPGRLTIYGRAIRTIHVVRRRKGTTTLALHARGRVGKHLNRRGWTRRKRLFVLYRSGGRRVKVRFVVRFLKRDRKGLSPKK